MESGIIDGWGAERVRVRDDLAGSLLAGNPRG